MIGQTPCCKKAGGGDTTYSLAEWQAMLARASTLRWLAYAVSRGVLRMSAPNKHVSKASGYRSQLFVRIQSHSSSRRCKLESVAELRRRNARFCSIFGRYLPLDPMGSNGSITDYRTVAHALP